MRRSILVTAILALLPCLARAQEPAAEPEVHEGGEIVVRDERLRPVEVFQDTAIETEWVREEEIEAIPATDAAQVIQNLAGIRTSQRLQGEDAAISIEGMPPEYTLLLVDGQRWSGEIGGVGDAADIPILNVSRIEVMRGNQGARFGTDAGGGVVNVVTHDAPEEGSALRYLGAGGTDGKGLGGAAGQVRWGPVGLSLAGEFDRIRGFDPPSDDDIVTTQIGGKDSLFEKHFLYGKWDAPIGNAVTLRGNGLWREENDDYVTVDEGLHFSREDTNWRGNVGADWLALDSTQVSGDFNYYAVDTDSQVGREFELFEDEFKGDLFLDHFLAIGPVENLIVGGTELVYQRLRLREGDLPPGIDNPDLEAGRRQNESFFTPNLLLTTESALTDWFSLILGGRVRFHSEFDTKFLPQAGVLLKPHDTLKLRASWGLNYRTPSLRDLYQPPTPQLGGAYFLAGNPNLDPEESMSMRAGFEWSPWTWVSLAAAGFYNDIDDHIRSQFAGTISIGTATIVFDNIIDTLPPEEQPAFEAICQAQQTLFPEEEWTPQCRAYILDEPVTVQQDIPSQVFRKTNLDSVQTWGSEVQLRLRATRYATFALDYTWLQTQVDDPDLDINELPNEPDHAVSVRGEFVAPRYDTALSAAFRWRSGVIPERSGTGLLSFADDSDRTDSSYSLDLRLAQPFWGERLRIFFDVLNVTDERREDSYGIRGRSYVAGISGTFEGPWSP